MLFDDEESRRLMASADYEAIADRLRNIGVHFEDRGEVGADAVEAVRQTRFRGGRSERLPASVPHGEGRK